MYTNFKHVLIFFFFLFISITSFSQIILPVEVLGEEGKVVTRNFDLTSQTASDTERLWMQINNLSYENKASVRVNGASWYDLNHDSVDMQSQERKRGGMVHGGFNTVRVSIPATNFVSGNNTIDFRFNNSDGISIGYRVVKFNLLDASGTKLLDAANFTDDDPDLWTAPAGTSGTDIAAGKILWDARNSLWSNYLTTTGNWYAYDLQQSTPIKAACADCHAHDGRDLELFSYSNESIIERAKFHKLTESEGEKIAAYIRSLSGTDSRVNRSGRPWNPPYQPGKELEGKPIDEWHAGAGLDAVLDEDADMLSYMFPDGVSKTSVDNFFDQDKPDIDRTTMPLAVQLPDWKHWLPLVHPMDAFDQGAFWDNTYNAYDQDTWRSPSNTSTKYNPLKAYEDFRSYLESLPKKADGKTVNIAGMSRAQKDELAHRHHIYSFNHRFFLGQQSAAWSKHWRVLTTDGTLAYAAKNSDIPFTMAVTSLARYFAVKNFEIMQEFGLQDQMDVMWDGEAPEDLPSKRHWLNSAESHNVFEVPPHFTAASDDGGIENFAGQPIQTGQYESTAWYQLQLILAGGEGQQWWNGPVDMNYQPEYILKAAISSGIKEPLRFYHSIAAMYKTKSWSGDVDPINGRGFNIRQEGPWWFFGKSPNAGLIHFFGHGPGSWAHTLNNIQPGLSKLFLDALFSEFLKGVNKHELSIWPRTGVPDWRLESVSKSSVFDVTTNSTPGGSDPYYADHMWWVIPQAIEHDVDCQIISDLIDWSQQAWPNINFNQFKTQLDPQLEVVFNECGERAYEVSTSNLGLNPTIEWQVNSAVVGGNSSTLSDSFFTEGDNVEVIATGENSCPTIPSTKNFSFTVPTLPVCIIPVDSVYYSFSNGTFLKDDWNNNDLVGTATQFNEGGDRGHVAQFASNSQYLATPSNSLKLVRPEVTIETWINLNLLKSNSGNQIQRIITLNPNGIILYRLNTQDKLEVGVRTTGSDSYEWVNMTGDLTNGAWTHLAVTISEEEMNIYVNGELNSNVTITSPINLVPSSGDVKVVISDGGFENSEGKIDDVKIYNRVLSVDEIYSSYTGIVVDPNPTVDEIIRVTGPEILVPGETFNVTVEYSATRTVDFLIFLQNITNEAVSDVVFERITAGTSLFTTRVPINGGLSPSTDMHRWVVQMFPEGGTADFNNLIEANFGGGSGYVVDIDSSLSFSYFDVEDEFSVYPNPTNGTLNVVIGENYRGLTANLVDLSGRVLISKQLNSSNNTIDLSLLSNGVYMLFTKERDKITSINKIVVSH